MRYILTDKRNYGSLSVVFLICMIVRLKVIANAKQDMICGMDGGFLKIKVATPPIDGKANRAIIELLSKALDIKKNSIRILSGEKSNIKTLELIIDENKFNSKLKGLVDANI